MTAITEIIRADSIGNIRIDTEEGHYWLSPAEIRDLLFFGRHVHLRQGDGTIDGRAIAYPHIGGEGIVIALFKRAYLVSRAGFAMVARGMLAATPMTVIPWEE